MEYKEVIPIEIRNGMSLRDNYLLTLAISGSNLVIPMVVGESEAQAFVMASESVEARRPMTHDLMNTIMEEYQLSVTRVDIEKIEEGIYYASLYISDGFNEKRIDCRPSDAIVLALKQKVPIRAAQRVIDEVAVDFYADDPMVEKPVEHQPTLEELERQLQQLLEKEEYELAAEVQAQIDKLSNQ